MRATTSPSLPSLADANTPSTAKRRHLLVGLGAAGAAGVAATALPLVRSVAPAEAATAGALAAASEAAGGYQLTAHVLRYYQTAKV